MAQEYEVGRKLLNANCEAENSLDGDFDVGGPNRVDNVGAEDDHLGLIDRLPVKAGEFGKVGPELADRCGARAGAYDSSYSSFTWHQSLEVVQDPLVSLVRERFCLEDVETQLIRTDGGFPLVYIVIVVAAQYRIVKETHYGGLAGRSSDGVDRRIAGLARRGKRITHGLKFELQVSQDLGHINVSLVIGQG